MAVGNDVVARILQRRADPTQLLQILREAQEELGWISPDAAAAIASGLGVPIARPERRAILFVSL
jgi:NADH:ubiquinone oxidoreductase subunit E